eukprot:jgi/Mesvir1/22584/Mv05005-RA.1
MAESDTIWKAAYEKRWGVASDGRDVAPAGWKAAFETRDRIARVGRDTTLVREGGCYYTCSEGKILTCWGSRKMSRGEHLAALARSAAPHTRPHVAVIPAQTSAVFEKVLFFLGDLLTDVNALERASEQTTAAA